MNVNTIKPEDFAIYVVELLGIKSDSAFTIADMINDISMIPSSKLPTFKDFLKSSIGKQDYDYKNGIQKFQMIYRDFEIQTRPKLSQKAYQKCDNYAEYLYKKTWKLFDKVTWDLEAFGRSIYEFKYEKSTVAGKPYFSEHDLRHLKKLGDVADIMNLVKRSPDKLKSELVKIIVSDTLVRYDPSRQLENKSEDKKILDQLKKRIA